MILSDMSAWDAFVAFGFVINVFLLRTSNPLIHQSLCPSSFALGVTSHEQATDRARRSHQGLPDRRGRDHALSGIHLSIGAASVSIAGPSGCGKSTLLSVLGLLDSPSDGTYTINTHAVAGLGPAERARIRNREIGFIFQSFNLIGDLTVYENVELPLTYRGMPAAERKKRVQDALERVGMAHRTKHYPAQLSGGQQQRVAVARAVVGSPSILLADEPTGNLDSTNSEAVMDLLKELHKGGATICMVTHDPRYSRYADRTILLFDGRVVEAVSRPGRRGGARRAASRSARRLSGTGANRRGERGDRNMANWTLDLRSALRGLRRSPGFAFMALLLVALSVGANTLLLTWLSAVVLEPLPGVRNVREFVHLSGQVGERGGLSLVPADLPVLQKSSRSLTDLIAHELEEVALVPGPGGEPEQLMGGIASGNYFQATRRERRPRPHSSAGGRSSEAAPVVVLGCPLAAAINADPPLWDA